MRPELTEGERREREAVLLGLPAEHDWNEKAVVDLYENDYAPFLASNGHPTAEEAVDRVLKKIEVNPLSSWLLADFIAYAVNRFIGEIEDPSLVTVATMYPATTDVLSLSMAGYTGSVVTFLRLDAFGQGNARSEVLSDLSISLALRDSQPPKGFTYA
jgi:hypothetical protein